MGTRILAVSILFLRCWLPIEFWFCCYEKHHHQGESLSFTSGSLSILEGNGSRNSRPGPEATEEHCFLSCSSVLYSAANHLRDLTAYSGLDLLMSTSDQENAHMDTGQSD